MGHGPFPLGRGLAIFAMLVTLSAIGSTRAQDSPDKANPDKANPSDPAIIVTGTHLSEQELQQRVSAVVKKFGVADGDKTAARWTDPICPRVFGLRSEHAKLVVEKLIAVAREAVVPVAKPNCRPNIAISFVSDGGQFVHTIAAKSAHYLAEVPQQERERLLRGQEPIGWWYATEVRGKDGTAGSTDSPPWAGRTLNGPAIATTGDNGLFSTYSSSIIGTQTIRTISQAMIVVDVAKADGFKLDAVSSYIAMIALAEIAFEPVPSPDSILSLFSTGKGLTDLTKWDAAFLSALYKIPLDRQALQQRGALRSAMTTRVLAGKP